MFSCFLCKQDADGSYNIYTSAFDNSKNLKTLLEEVTNKLLDHSDGKICSNCYQLLNELHFYQKKVKDISDKLNLYLTYCNEKSCPVEVQVTAQNDSLENQKAVEAYTQKPNFKCHLCFKVFVSKAGVSRHLKKQHSETTCKTDNVKPMKNDASEETAETIVSKKRNHEKPKTFQCSECPKRWKTSGELKNHLNSHSNIKPFICEICGQAYKHKTALDVHVGMHNGICPFTCVYCKKTFTQKGALRRHLPIHTGDFFKI